ncbi:hypothetical protein [Vibrio hannami]
MALAGFQLLIGKPGFMFPIHFIGHELSSLYDMTHGVTLALITPAWMEYTVKEAPESLSVFAKFARNVFDIRESDDMAAFNASIDKLKSYYSTIGMPENLRAAGVEEDKLEYLAEKATENGQLGAFNAIGKPEALEILRAAF